MNPGSLVPQTSALTKLGHVPLRLGPVDPWRVPAVSGWLPYLSATAAVTGNGMAAPNRNRGCAGAPGREPPAARLGSGP